MIRMQVCIFGFRLLFVQDFFCMCMAFLLCFLLSFLLVLAGIFFSFFPSPLPLLLITFPMVRQSATKLEKKIVKIEQ